MKIALGKSHFAGPISGADEALVSYAIALRKAGHKVQVVLLFRCPADDQYYLRLKKARVRVSFVVRRSFLFEMLRLTRDALASTLFFILLIPRSRELLRSVWQAVMRLLTRSHFRLVCDFLDRGRPDVLHVFTPDAGAALMIRGGHQIGIPVLYHEMGTAHHLQMLARSYSQLEQVLPLCREVSSLSPRLAAEWSVRYPFLPSVSVVPLIFDGPRSSNYLPQTATDKQEVVFGFAARLEEGKGPLILLDALASVNQRSRLAVARIAGVGIQMAEVKARARELVLGDACEFVAPYSEPLGRSAFMNSLDVFVLPSLAEGTPYSIVEAMAHGVPVIASTVGGIPDVLGDDAGILVPAGDAAALAEAMLKLAKDTQLRKKMGAAALERYQKLFSANVVLPLLLDVYQRAMGNGHKSETITAGNGNLHPWARSQAGDGRAYASAGADSLVDRQAAM